MMLAILVHVILARVLYGAISVGTTSAATRPCRACKGRGKLTGPVKGITHPCRACSGKGRL